MKKVLAINSGSSSSKYKLFFLDNEKVIASGMADHVGLPGSVFTMTLVDGSQHDERSDITSQEEAVQKLLSWSREYNVIDSLVDTAGVGHRVVADGEEFTDNTVVTDDNLWKIYDMSGYAPSRNPVEADDIYAFMEVLPSVPEVAVFDAFFHQSLDPAQYLYSVPYKCYEKLHARKCGTYDTSARYVSRRTADLLKKPVGDLRTTLCYLSSDTSVTVIKDGKSFGTPMGSSPVTGVTTGTRSGDVDPSLLRFIMKKGNITSFNEVIRMLNIKSDLLGFSRISPGVRDIEKAIRNDDKQTKLTKNTLINRAVCYIGTRMTEMDDLDILVFTAEIGEHGANVGKQVMNSFTWLGLEYDKKTNKASKEGIITTPKSKITVMVVPTNEGLIIVRDIVHLAKLDK